MQHKHCTGTDILTKDSHISLRQTLVSANEFFELGFFNPGMKLEKNGKTQDKHLMTSWESDDDPTPGKFVVGLSSDQPPQVLLIDIVEAVMVEGGS